MYEYREFQYQYSHLEYKMPGRHLMSDNQYAKFIADYANKIIKLSEMPPIFIPRNTSPKQYLFEVNVSYNFQLLSSDSTLSYVLFMTFGWIILIVSTLVKFEFIVFRSSKFTTSSIIWSSG